MDTQEFKIFGKYLRGYRRMAKKTQKEIADELGYTPQFIANWERGASMPPFDRMVEVAKAYKLSKGILFSKLNELSLAYWKRNLWD